jgi:hypothetical protein
MLSNGKCKECEAGSYLIALPTEPNFCLSCKNERSVCLGGNRVYPQAGFWRISEESDDIMPCINSEACLGGINDNNLLGTCATGYQGILCATC